MSLTREELVKQKAREFASSGEFSPSLTECFIAGAEWAHKRLVHNACEWLKEYMYIEHIFEYSEDEKPVHYVCASACDSVDEFINEFKKAMEE